jgi:hypothetical protein
MYLKLPDYTASHENYPAETAPDGSATIIQNSITHHQLNIYSPNLLQVISVFVENSVVLLTISAIYLIFRY